MNESTDSRGVRRKFAEAWLPGLVVLLVLLLVYGGTLERGVGSGESSYMNDVGEIQVALNLWGTVHFTGYPTYTILSALLTHALRAGGLSPAAVASASSTVWSLLGLVLTYRLVVRITAGERVLAALSVLALGLVETFWVHSVVAEVYGFSMLLVSATLLVALRLAERWEERRWWLTVFLLGLGAQHHRLLLLLVPVVLLIVGPALKRSRRAGWAFAVKSAVFFALPFLFYLYLPLRARQGALWVYGQPGTWEGFWTEFSGREPAPYVLGWPQSPAAWFENLGFLVDQLRRQISLPALLGGGGGLVWLALRRRKRNSPWAGLALLAGTVACAAFVVAFPAGVWAPAALMPAIFFLLVGLAYLLHRLAEVAPPLRWAGWVGLAVLASWLFYSNLPFVQGLVSDPRDGEVIRMLGPLEEADLPGGRDVVALPWGGDYFAAAYGLYVTEDLGGFALVDHRVDFQSVVAEEGKVITLASNLGYWSLDWWTDLLGEAHFSTAAPGLAMVSREPLYRATPEGVGFALGNGVQVRGADLGWEGRGELRVTLYWEALREVPSDYSVAIHLVGQDPPQGAEDILAQADSLHPVGGWYPTSLWVAGEVVRDDYALVVPPGSSPVAVRVAMYRRDESGAFVNTQWLSLPVPGSF